MNPKLDRRFLPLILTSLVVLGIPSCICQNDYQYQSCSEPFECGRLSQIGYPFYGGNRPLSCGYPGFELTCQGDDDPLINIASITYRVLAIDNSTSTLRVARNDLWDNLCPTSLSNTTLNSTPFNFYPPANDQNITLYYGCTGGQLPPSPSTPVFPNQFSCNVNGINGWSFFMTRAAASFPEPGITCSDQISVWVNQTADQGLSTTSLLQAALQTGFSIQYSANNDNCNDCRGSGGLCGYNPSSRSFACHCINGTFESTCNGTPTGNGNGTYE